MPNFTTVVIYFCLSFWLIEADITEYSDQALRKKSIDVTSLRYSFPISAIDEGLQDSALSRPFTHIGCFWKPRSNEIQNRITSRPHRAGPVRPKSRKRIGTAFSHSTDGKRNPAIRKFHVKRQSMLGLRQKCAYPACDIRGSYGVPDNNSTQTGHSIANSSRKLFCRYAVRPKT